MPTLTIRNVPPKVVRSLKLLARRNGRSMEQEVRTLLKEHIDRDAVLEQIERAWDRQSRRPQATEIEEWRRRGRE